MAKSFVPTRRAILKSGGGLVVAFSLAGRLDAACAEGRPMPRPVNTRTLALTDLDAFLVVDFEGQCTVYSGKVDLGTGTNTALLQIVAEELDLPLGKVNLVTGDTAADRKSTRLNSSHRT